MMGWLVGGWAGLLDGRLVCWSNCWLLYFCMVGLLNGGLVGLLVCWLMIDLLN